MEKDLKCINIYIVYNSYGKNSDKIVGVYFDFSEAKKKATENTHYKYFIKSAITPENMILGGNDLMTFEPIEFKLTLKK